MSNAQTIDQELKWLSAVMQARGLISFEKKEETRTEDYKTVRKEFSFRSFKRSFNLDDRIDTNGIQAKYENGVLKLLLPKKEEKKESAKQISVQ